MFAVLIHLWSRNPSHGPNNVCLWTQQHNLGQGLQACKSNLSPSHKYQLLHVPKVYYSGHIVCCISISVYWPPTWEMAVNTVVAGDIFGGGRFCVVSFSHRVSLVGSGFELCQFLSFSYLTVFCFYTRFSAQKELTSWLFQNYFALFAAFIYFLSTLSVPDHCFAFSSTSFNINKHDTLSLGSLFHIACWC